nr:MAG TPA: hypothetical protein [Caudoviricetes sp.]
MVLMLAPSPQWFSMYCVSFPSYTFLEKSSLILEIFFHLSRNALL